MLILLILLLYFLLKHNQEHPRPEVHLDYATYKGLTLHHGVNQYLGMRFAAPPVDDLRWRAPRDPHKEEDVQDASEVRILLLPCEGTLTNLVSVRFQFGPICLGTHHGYSSNEDEDCLFVNVWAPQGANETTTKPLPVWVFIQGGGRAPFPLVSHTVRLFLGARFAKV